MKSVAEEDVEQYEVFIDDYQEYVFLKVNDYSQSMLVIGIRPKELFHLKMNLYEFLC